MHADLLTPYGGRAPRTPLDAWAARGVARLAAPERAAAGPEAALSERCRCLNQAALIQLLGGEPEAAATLCWRQLAFLGRGWDDREPVDGVVCAFQPWINLARLDRGAGAYPAARERLQVLA